MGPSVFVIAILGCADGGEACTQVATVPTRYESEAACSAATSDALIRNSDLDFPTLVAQCRRTIRPASMPREEAPAGARNG